MKLKVYDPKLHAAEVLAAWERALGGAYPIADRVFWQNTVGNPFYEHGDGFVAIRARKVVGFALAKVERAARPMDKLDGSVGAIFVVPEMQRRGFGAALMEAVHERLLESGVRECGAATPAFYRFWPGVPTDLQPAYEFFNRHGYSFQRGCFDLVRDLRSFRLPKKVRETIAREGVEIRPAKEDEVADLLRFERREFRGWEQSTRFMIGCRETDHLIIVKRGRRIIGLLQTFSPRSRMRAANVVWERLLGEDVGGMGAVGIARNERGKGLGLALVAVASKVLKERGVGNAHIDWTGLVDFYGKLGYKPWREYWRGRKALA